MIIGDEPSSVHSKENVKVICDECNSELAEGDECYCEKCVGELRDLIEERDETIAKLEKEIDKMGG